jgi:hypothetical protein
MELLNDYVLISVTAYGVLQHKDTTEETLSSETRNKLSLNSTVQKEKSEMNGLSVDTIHEQQNSDAVNCCTYDATELNDVLL